MLAGLGQPSRRHLLGFGTRDHAHVPALLVVVADAGAERVDAQQVVTLGAVGGDHGLFTIVAAATFFTAYHRVIASMRASVPRSIW